MEKKKPRINKKWTSELWWQKLDEIEKRLTKKRKKQNAKEK